MKILIIDTRNQRRANIINRIEEQDPDKKFIDVIDEELEVEKNGIFLDPKDYNVIFLHASESQKRVEDFFNIKCKNKLVIAYSGGDPILFECWDKNIHFSMSNISDGYEEFLRIEDFIRKYIKTGELDCKLLVGESIEALFLLKHKIAHLWFPLDIDLQGIKEVEGKTINNEDAQVVYLRDILKDANIHHYSQKLSNLRYALTRDEDKSEVNKIRAETNFMDSINQSINELIDQEKKEDSVVWKTLMELAGLDENLNPKINSPIVEFIKQLDEIIKKANNINKDDVREILDYFKDKKWKIKEANIEKIESFHDWFIHLNEKLEKIINLE